MFSSRLFKRIFPLKNVNSTRMFLTLRSTTSWPIHPTKNMHFNHSGKYILRKEISTCPLRKISSGEFSCKDESRNIANQVTKLLHHVNIEIGNFHRVKIKDAEMLLNYLQKDRTIENDKYSLLLLEWCVQFMPDMNSSSRISFAHSVWNTFSNLGVTFSKEHYNALLKCYASNGHSVSVSKFLADMGHIKPDKSTFDLLLECACEAGDVEQAKVVLQLMKEENIPISETTFNSLILGHARAGDIKSSVLTLDTMKAANLVPSANTYTALLRSYAEFGDIEQMKEIYRDATLKNILLNDFQLKSVYMALATRKHHVCLQKFLAVLPKNHVKSNSIVGNTILELVHQRCEEAALLLVMSIPTGTENISHLCELFTLEMCKTNTEPMNIIKVCNQLESKDIFPRALYKAAEFFLQLAKPDAALLILHTLFEKGEALRCHYFWPIFRQRARLDGERGVLTTLKDMQTLGLTPDFQTLTDYILPVISIHDPETIIQKLQAYGISVRQCLTPVAAVMMLSGNLKSVSQLYDIYPTKVDFEKLLQPLVEAFVAKKNVSSVTRLIKMFGKSSTTDLAGHFLLELVTIKKSRFNSKDIVNFLQAFKKEGISISTFAADVLSQFFTNEDNASDINKKGILLLDSLNKSELYISSAEMSAVHIAHPRDMNMDELESHLVELKGKNMNTRGTLRRLLQLHMQQRNVKRVLELKKELEEDGFKFSPGMKALLFSMYTLLKDVCSAEKCLNEIMHESPDFVMDEHKIIDYATLLVTEKQYKVAVTLLERRAVSGKILGGEKISRNCWNLLNAIAMQGETKKVNHMLHLLKTLGFCSVSNTLLGPLVRAYLRLADTEGAVEVYQKCIAEYRKTPLQQELLTHLVKSVCETPENKHLLEDVLVATSSVHGEPSTLVAYAVALAENGKRKQLEKFFMENSSSIENAILLKRAKRLAKEGKLNTLKILAVACMNLSNVDLSLLYTYILQIHDTQGDCESAMQLWTEMQERNIQPSLEFLQSFSSIMKSHNKSVAFSL